MPKVSLPEPQEPIGVCPHCGTGVRMNKTWRDKLQEIVRVINGLS